MRHLSAPLAGLAALASTCAGQVSNVLWSVPTPYPPRALAVSPTGDRVATGWGRGPGQDFPGQQIPGIGGYSVLDSVSGTPLRSSVIPGWSNSPNDIAFSPDGSELAFAIGDGQVREPQSGKLISTLPVGSGSAHQVAFSADGVRTFLGVTTISGSGVQVYQTQNGANTNEFGLVGFVTALGATPPGAPPMLAAADDRMNTFVFSTVNPDHEQLVRILEDPNPAQPDDALGSTTYVFGLAFTPDGTALATMSDQRINLWRLGDGVLLRTLESPQHFDLPGAGEFFRSVAISPDGRFIAAGGIELNNGGNRGTVNIWRIADGALVAHVEDTTPPGEPGVIGEGAVNRVAFSPDGERLYLAADAPPHVLAIAVAPPCTPDMGCAGGLRAPDGLLDNNDFIVFIDLFFRIDAAADIGRAGGTPGPDGAFDNNDFIAFINAFFTGCQ